MTNTERRTTSFWFKMRFHHWCCETSPSTKTMATRAMKAIQAKTATKTMSARAMKAKTAMKTMSTRAMKAKKAKTALKTMSKKAMQAMKAKKVGRKSLVPAGTKVKTTGGLNKQDDPLGPIDLALSIHEDRHDSPKRPIAPMALRTQRLHQANSPKKMTKKAMESAGTQAVSPKRFREASPPHDYDDVKTQCHACLRIMEILEQDALYLTRRLWVAWKASTFNRGESD